MTPALIDRQRKLIMVWSPKAGCTSAVQMFFDHMGLLREALAYHHWVHVYRERVFYRDHPPPTEDEWNDPAFFKFKVVRNPYDRAVSGFLGHYVNILGNRCSFAQFLDDLNDRKVRSNPHFAPQACARKFDRIVKIERMAEDIESVNQATGSRLKGSFRLHAFVKTAPTGVYCGDREMSKPLPDVVPGYDDFYNEAHRYRVNVLYGDDFRLYGYPQR